MSAEYSDGRNRAVEEVRRLAATEEGREHAARLLLERLTFGDSDFDHGYQDGLQAVLDLGSTVDLYGRCARWCTDLEDNPGGMSNHEHGRWCRSESVFAEGLDADTGQRQLISAEGLSPYFHGTMPRDQIDLHNRLSRVIGLYLGDAIEPTTVLTPGEARQLAAGLVRLADHISMAEGLK